MNLKPINILLLAIMISVISCLQNAGDKKAIPVSEMSDDSLLTLVQYRTFQYFWDGAEPVSGMARERFHVDGVYPENDMNVITSGGSGFGMMAILTGIERGFISREEGLGGSGRWSLSFRMLTGFMAPGLTGSTEKPEE